MKIYQSSMSKGYVLTTILLLALLVGMIYRLYSLLEKSPGLSSWSSWLWALCCFLPILAVLCYGAQLRSLRWDGEMLTLVRMWGSVVIAKEDILEVTTKKSMTWDTSLWGMNGLFGALGWFYDRSIGKYFAIVNNGNSLIVIKTKKRTYVVNCDEREDFLKNFREK